MVGTGSSKSAHVLLGSQTSMEGQMKARKEMPKKSNHARNENDLREIYPSFNFMSDEMSKVAKEQTALMELINKVKQWKAQVSERAKKLLSA